MKLVTFEISTAVGPVLRIGALHQENIIDLNAGYTRYLADKRDSGRAYEMAAATIPPDMIGFFRSGKSGKEAAQTTIDFVKKSSQRQLSRDRWAKK